MLPRPLAAPAMPVTDTMATSIKAKNSFIADSVFLLFFIFIFINV